MAMDRLIAVLMLTFLLQQVVTKIQYLQLSELPDRWIELQQFVVCETKLFQVDQGTTYPIG